MAEVTIVASRLTTTGLRPAYGSLLFEPYPVPLNLPDGILSPGGVRVFLDELGDTVADLEPLGNGRAYRVTVSIGGVEYVEYVPVVGDAAYHELPRVDEATLTTVTDAPPAWTVALDTETAARTAADTTEAAARAAADTAEATTRAAADTALSGRLAPLEAALPTLETRVDTLEADDSAAWASITGKPATYPATAHTHPTTDVVGFTTAVDARVQAIVGAAPAALDTLDELAAALGDDANFAGTVTTQLTNLDTRLDSAEAVLAAATPNATVNTIVERNGVGDIGVASAYTWQVYLGGPTTAADHATRKDYVDAAIAAAVGSARYHALVGG